MAPNTGIKRRVQIDPKQYAAFIQGLELLSLYAFGGRFSVNRDEVAPGSSVEINDTATYQEAKHNQTRVLHSYRMRVSNPRTKKRSVELDLDICLVLSSKEKWTAELFEAYKKNNLRLNTWPFFREFVFSTTSRMNVPPITLPLVKRLI